jgi:S1-C subfamily serine protease
MAGRPSGTGYLGIQLDDSGDGATVTLVGSNSPASRIGIHVGDRILRIDGGSTGCFHDVLEAIWRHKPGEPLEVAVRRDGQMRIFDVTLEKHPRD